MDCEKVEEIELSKANVIKVVFKDQSWFAIRPSGTEPKLKIYYSVFGKTKGVADKIIMEIEDNIVELVGNIS